MHIKDPVDPQLGLAMDFTDITRSFQPLLNQLDRHYINQIEGLSNLTSENLTLWIWKNLKPVLPQLSEVVVQESTGFGCIYKGEK